MASQPPSAGAGGARPDPGHRAGVDQGAGQQHRRPQPLPRHREGQGGEQQRGGDEEEHAISPSATASFSVSSELKARWMSNITSPITKTAAKRSSSTPTSTMAGMKSERSRPSTKTPFSSTRKPSTWPTALRRVTMSRRPHQTVPMEVGTSSGCFPGTGQRQVRPRTRPPPRCRGRRAPWLGAKPTSGAISRLTVDSRVARASSQGMPTAFTARAPSASTTTWRVSVASLASTTGRSASRPPCAATARMPARRRDEASTNRSRTSTRMKRRSVQPVMGSSPQDQDQREAGEDRGAR